VLSNTLVSERKNISLPQCLRYKNRLVRKAEFPVNIGSVFFHGKLETENGFRDLLVGKTLHDDEVVTSASHSGRPCSLKMVYGE
jgi:hypothetical protein